ncbi:adenylylsulfatase HINT3 isoform X1 [Dendrobium catenatum]|uniref:adenylylsulfatase HINT3 isoform X1 n=1 Tax=Dendrobium catenatum TaxID=906689 RepID=UPI0009F33779|nr:adenylylsulfatase HINT3 isoform X1 [Dendrobium catenatum]
MERRRLALLCSHLCSTGRPPLLCALPPVLSASSCHASAGDGGRPEGDTEKERCVFCLIVRGESPAFKLYEDDVCLCILDSNPLSFGHSLIIPKLHFPSLQATPPSVVAAMCSTVPFLTKAIMKATQCDSFNLLVNNGTAAGQVIFHTHLHIIPRRAGDQLWPSEGHRQPIEQNQETLSLVSRIRERISPQPTACCSTLESQLHKNLHD